MFEYVNLKAHKNIITGKKQEDGVESGIGGSCAHVMS